MPSGRAVLFDLDDTLYPLERFIRSGFRAVASDVEAAWGVPRGDALAVLDGAFVSARGRELQELAAQCGLDTDVVPRLVETIRRHVPDLRLPALSLSVLRTLRGGWRLGLVTNGRPEIQARKVRALGLERLVDVVVYAEEHGSGRGKPEAAPFLAACRALAVPVEAAVFVGDDPVCDMAGAHAAGLRTIWVPVRRDDVTRPLDAADCTVASLAAVPAAAARLDTPDWRAHVA